MALLGYARISKRRDLDTIQREDAASPSYSLGGRDWLAGMGQVPDLA